MTKRDLIKVPESHVAVLHKTLISIAKVQQRHSVIRKRFIDEETNIISILRELERDFTRIATAAAEEVGLDPSTVMIDSETMTFRRR